jgi:hypothetical protein
MKRYAFLISAGLGLALLGASCSWTTTVNQNVNTTVNTNTASSVSYTGQDSKNALELLESKHSVDVSDQGFVNAIDGVHPGTRQFWALYVNGKQADVGAKELITKSTDTFEWKLESY